MFLIRILKNWTLPIAMGTGVLFYLIYTQIEWFSPTRSFAREIAQTVQPIFIATMLFITFCKIDPSKLRFCKWHAFLLLFQTILFLFFALLLYLFPHTPWRVLLESTMLCFICPTATAAVVITGKLGGNTISITSYTIFVNILTALLIPLVIPFAHPQIDMTFLPSLLLIIKRVFPVLICPFLAAWLLRIVAPRLQTFIAESRDVTFYMWAVSLSIAIAITTNYMLRAELSVLQFISMALIALICCILQFTLGRFIGNTYGDKISAGQALGQKNTIFAIWMGYTFLSPATTVVGGFYLVCHNLINTYQLYLKRMAVQKNENSVEANRA